jgi:hypothetical protein
LNQFTNSDLQAVVEIFHIFLISQFLSTLSRTFFSLLCRESFLSYVEKFSVKNTVFFWVISSIISHFEKYHCLSLMGSQKAILEHSRPTVTSRITFHSKRINPTGEVTLSIQDTESIHSPSSVSWFPILFALAEGSETMSSSSAFELGDCL